MSSEFSIPFVGLKDGTHNFKYEISGAFFEEYENSDIDNCKIEVDLKFEKSNSLFILEFSIDGSVEVECDRCSDKYDQSIFGDYTVFVKFDETNKENEDDVIYISRDDSHLDVKELIYDYINLSIPLKKIHPQDDNGNSTCNQSVLKFLDNSVDEEISKDIDPRWEVLKKIKTKK